MDSYAQLLHIFFPPILPLCCQQMILIMCSGNPARSPQLCLVQHLSPTCAGVNCYLPTRRAASVCSGSALKSEDVSWTSARPPPAGVQLSESPAPHDHTVRPYQPALPPPPQTTLMILKMLLIWRPLNAHSNYRPWNNYCQRLYLSKFMTDFFFKFNS